MGCPTDAVWNSHGDNGWEVDEDFEVNCIEGCNDITTVPPTTITIPDGSIPCVPGFAEAGHYYAEDECDGTAQCDNGQDENYGLLVMAAVARCLKLRDHCWKST